MTRPLIRLLMASARIHRLRNASVKAILKLEGGVLHSATYRVLLKRDHQVELGRYSYGRADVLEGFPKGTRIANYCSIAPGVSIFRRNHPIERLSLHPFFYNHDLGLIEKDTIITDLDNPLHIGNDVWIGRDAIVLPRCRVIGDGAIIGAGAVVSRDVPDFAVVGGNPARILRYRFTDSEGAAVKASKWWTYSIEELKRHLDLFQVPLDTDRLTTVFDAAKD